jgi:hypothetical protein
MMLHEILRGVGQDSASNVVLRQTEGVARSTRLAEYFDFSARPSLPESLERDIRQKSTVPALPKDTPRPK